MDTRGREKQCQTKGSKTGEVITKSTMEAMIPQAGLIVWRMK